jgi:NAD(P)-dependent dehydrogenase (short-subunit alcohol dehydrogenase family)/catechol-2,3-dioxygenase
MSKLMGVRHVGLLAKDPGSLAQFYQDVMGMTVVRQTPASAPIGATVFLVRHPDGGEDHDVVLVSNPAMAHTAFEVASLGELKSAYRETKERGVPIKFALNHGNQLSYYVEDPEGHLIEMYWLIHYHFPPPVAEPIDLDLPEEELLREVERTAKRLGVPAPVLAPGTASGVSQQKDRVIAGRATAGRGRVRAVEGRQERGRAAPDFIGVRHVNLPAKNLAAIAAFYRAVIGMTVVKETPATGSVGATLLLALHPGGEEAYDLVFFSNSAMAHTAFEVESLDELKRAYREMKRRGVPIKMVRNHGTSFSFYFEDPEGHNLEIYWQTSARVPPDFFARPIDLDRPEEELLREVEMSELAAGVRQTSTSKVWLITGSSRGFGRCLAEAVLDAGDRLVATARHPEQLADLVSRYGERVRAVGLDVTSVEEARAAVATAVEAFGRLDVVINNAGYGYLAAIEDANEADMRAELETDLWGVIHVTRAALPVLRQQRSGHIVQISSALGRTGVAGMGAYSMAKAAINGFSASLAREVAPLGIKVTIIEPGSLRTSGSCCI